MPSTIGLFFIGLGAFFYALRYICAAIIEAGNSMRVTSNFWNSYSEIGPDLTHTALFFFIVGTMVLFSSYLPALFRFWNNGLSINEPK